MFSSRLSRCIALAAASLAITTAARADDSAAKAAYPSEVVDRPFTLPKGMSEADLDLGIDLSDGLAFQPVSPAVTYQYGVSNELQLAAQIGFCLNGPGDGCSSALGNIAFQGTYSIGKLGSVATALFAGVNFGPVSPNLEAGIPLGAEFRFTPAAHVFSIVVAPVITIALTDRSTFQWDTIGIPFMFQYQATKKLNLQLSTGFNFGIDPPDPIGVGDTLAIPLGLTATFAVTNLFDLGASFVFPNLFGNGGSADLRVLSLHAGARF